MTRHFALFFIFHFLFFIVSFAQPNSASRYEIDAKRIGVSPLENDALPRSREFIRLDSAYYVGYMFEGIYRSDKSSDYIGYRNAIPSLRKAFALIQKDYGSALQQMFQSPQNYMQSMSRYADFLQIATTLKECYDNIEMPDSLMWVLNEVNAYNFPKEHFPINTTKAWTYHRNRFFTSGKFSFLKNSVEENEKAAFGFCYYALFRIGQNRAINDVWFGPMQAENDRLSVYHYLALLHAYNKNYDSSEYYYREMANTGAVSWNNYALLKFETGDLATAHDYFNRNGMFDFGRKSLKETSYYLPMLDVCAGRTKEAIARCKSTISDAGSTPGFGWYNIALGRSYLYDGQLDSAAFALNKAAGFKELHIGTTLTQSQYDFSINLLKLQLIEKKIALIKFQDKGWWYSPSALYKVAGLKIEKLMLQYIVVNELAINPERNRTVYDLFCGESTTTFDEAYYLIKDFTPSYFEKKYKSYQAVDKRKNLQRYFKLFTAIMQRQNGDENKAFAGYKSIVKNVSLDTENEKLFLARVYEGMAQASHEEGNDNNEGFYSNALFEAYPQLIPFSSSKVKMKLVIAGVEDEITAKFSKELRNCNYQWMDNADKNTSVAYIDFEKNGNSYKATINVKSASNTIIVNNQKLVFKNVEGVGKEISLRLCGKGGGFCFRNVVSASQKLSGKIVLTFALYILH